MTSTVATAALGAAAASGSGAAAGGTGAVAAVGALIDGLSPQVLHALELTLTRPFHLGPEVTAAWSVTRDVALGLLVVAVLYGVLRAQIAGALGLDAVEPWRLLPRLALAALGVATSLPLARGVLLANNALCAAILQRMPVGDHGLLRPLTAGLVLTALPALLGIGPAVTALAVLIGEAALACFYVIRSAEIVLLALLLPLAAALWVVPAAAGVWMALMAELVVAVFVQSLQVVVLLVFAAGMGIGGPAGGGSWLWSIGALALIFRCRGLLARAVGAGAQMGPSLGLLAGGARNLGGLAALGAGRLTSGLMRGSPLDNG